MCVKRKKQCPIPNAQNGTNGTNGMNGLNGQNGNPGPPGPPGVSPTASNIVISYMTSDPNNRLIFNDQFFPFTNLRLSNSATGATFDALNNGWVLNPGTYFMTIAIQLEYGDVGLPGFFGGCIALCNVTTGLTFGDTLSVPFLPNSGIGRRSFTLLWNLRISLLEITTTAIQYKSPDPTDLTISLPLASTTNPGIAIGTWTIEGLF